LLGADNMVSWWWVIVAAWAGATFGVLIMAMVKASK
jgi:hypothetical protein